MKLRLGTIEDAAEMERVAIAAIGESGYTPEQIDVWLSGFTEERMRELCATSFVMIVEANGEVLGFATLIERGETAGELDLWYVSPDFKRRGVGKMLVRGIEDRARQLDMTAVWVDASLPATHRLEQLGYRVHDDYKKTVNDVVFRNTWMVKRFI
jgi:putative acetyltransferase